jgi:hypothetical protein
MKKIVILMILLIFTLVSTAQSNNNENPRIAFSAGMGTYSISNYQFKEPFSINQLGVNLDSKVKIQIKRNQENKKSWLFYSNSLMCLKQPNSPLSQWSTPMILPTGFNLIHEQKIGFIIRKWLLIDGGYFKELGTRKMAGLTGGIGFIYPFKNSSLELKGNFYLNPNLKNGAFIPGIIFHFDPKQ